MSAAARGRAAAQRARWAKWKTAEGGVITTRSRGSTLITEHFSYNRSIVATKNRETVAYSLGVGGPQYFSIQFTTSLIISFRGMLCEASKTTRRLCSGGVPNSSNSGSCEVAVGKK